MDLQKKLKNNPVFPDNNVLFLVYKWGITSAELNEAILETGSLNEIHLRKYLIQKKVLFSVFGVFYFSMNSLRDYFKFKLFRNRNRSVKTRFSGIHVRYMTINYN